MSLLYSFIYTVQKFSNKIIKIAVSRIPHAIYKNRKKKCVTYNNAIANLYFTLQNSV